MEVNVFGYSNPTQTCQDCRDGGQFANPGCCDTHNRIICVESDRCDSYFFYCLRTIGSSGRNCSYFGSRLSTVNYQDEAVDFSQNLVLGLENPLLLRGLTDTYHNAVSCIPVSVSSIVPRLTHFFNISVAQKFKIPFFSVSNIEKVREPGGKRLQYSFIISVLLLN